MEARIFQYEQIVSDNSSDREHCDFSPAKSLQRLLVIRSTECVILRDMRLNTSIFTVLTAVGMLACHSSAACPQPPLVTPKPGLKSLQAPAIGPHHGEDSTEQDEFSDLPQEWFLIDYDGATIGYESLSTAEVAHSTREAGVSDSPETMPVVRRSRETR